MTFYNVALVKVCETEDLVDLRSRGHPPACRLSSKDLPGLSVCVTTHVFCEKTIHKLHDQQGRSKSIFSPSSYERASIWRNRTASEADSQSAYGEIR